MITEVSSLSPNMYLKHFKEYKDWNRYNSKNMPGPTITHCIHKSNNELNKSLKTGQGLQGQKNPLFEVCSRCETCAKAPKRCWTDTEKILLHFHCT